LKTCPAPGVAARLIDVPDAAVMLHVAPQLMPAGELVTVPLPESVTERVNRGTKDAVTEVFAFRATTQVPVPAHAPPLQPVNTDPAAAVALSVIEVPLM
jgi:hypothetical protein